MQIAKADCAKRLQPAHDRRAFREKGARLVNREFEYLIDIPSQVAQAQNMALEAAPVAGLAAHLEIGHEMHLDRHGARALTALAAPSAYVKGKIARLNAEPPGFRTGRKQLTDIIVDFQIGGGIRAHRTRRHLLPHMDNLANLLKAVDAIAGASLADARTRASEIIAVEHVLDQR